MNKSVLCESGTLDRDRKTSARIKKHDVPKKAKKGKRVSRAYNTFKG